MTRQLPGLVLFLTLSATTVALADDKADKLVGTWAYKTSSGEDQIWVITNTNGTWAVKGSYQKDGAETGSFVGVDVKYADGVLTYTHKYVKKPSENLQDNAPVRIKAGEMLTYNWGKDYAKGPRMLARHDAGKPGGKDVAKTPPKKEDRFVGTWKGFSDNHNQVWTVTHADGVWSVRAVYQRNGVEVGSAVGVEVKYADDTLSFKRKFVKKPVTDWKDEIGMAIKVDGVNLVCGPVGGQTRVLEPVKEGPAGGAKDKEPAKDAAKFMGAWQGQVEEYTTLWDIRQKDGKWQVAVGYYTKNPKTGALTEVGSYVGTDPEIKDGQLVFETNYIKKPPGWASGKITCKLVDEDSFEYVLETGGIKKKPRTVTRLKK